MEYGVLVTSVVEGDWWIGKRKEWKAAAKLCGQLTCDIRQQLKPLD
jgi:hypothetical protein